MHVDKKNRNCVHVTKIVARENHLLPKNTECLYVRQEHAAAQNTKIVFLGDMGCCLCDKFCCLKKQKLNSNDISSSHVRQELVARETGLVAQKHRNCVCATSAHKHCKFINRSTLANFGKKNKITIKTTFILHTHLHKNNKLLTLYDLLHYLWYKSQT